MRLLTSLNLAFFTFLIGCQSEQDIIPSLNKTPKIRELSYSVYSNLACQFVYFTDGRLNKRITKSWIEDPKVYSSDTVEYQYNGSNYVTTIKFSQTSHMNFIYDSDGNITQSDFNFIDSGIPIRYTNKYFYYENRLSKIQIGDGEFTVIFLYDTKGNLLTKTHYYKGDEFIRVTYIEYDDKPNPFKGNQFIFDNGGFDLENTDYFSNNNPLKYEVWYGRNNHTDTQSHSYTYNSNGFWTQGRSYSINYY